MKVKYQIVHPKFSIERFRIFRWVENLEDNKIIISNSSQILVRQECYGAEHVHDFTSWILEYAKLLMLKESVAFVQ
ncbi:histone-lysine N-methyltransferase ATX3 [Medicago truncatula]|uniref:Histone-lysine N-methyltransferase ATX3 n=1 Tax=Medicago truncatula TaxID=3880 RepID=A0A072TT86_MEDTR|nr:histone-lysine N-methyltransferase ATX3 [Medicago truncatula]